jgi:hypothetical protein
MHAWVDEMNAALTSPAPSIHILEWFGHTGNFVAASELHEPAQVAKQLEVVLKTNCAVFPLDKMEAIIKIVTEAPKPEAETGVRWTPGIVLQVRTGERGREVTLTEHAYLWRITASAVGAWKRDFTVAKGTLDPDRRAGGWGAVAGDVRRQVGGQWTARSLNTVRGIVHKARAFAGVAT